jgi:hypothetical protein
MDGLELEELAELVLVNNSAGINAFIGRLTSICKKS